MFAKLKKRVQGDEAEGATVHGSSPSHIRREPRGRGGGWGCWCVLLVISIDCRIIKKKQSLFIWYHV